jgi:4-amino-4-deoxy-L-arabinose transferase-like glycosyltransferase
LLRPQRYIGRGRFIAELRRHRWALADAGLLLLLALALRLPALATWPDVLSGDEGMVANIARDLMASRLGNVFGSSWAHSTLYYYTLGVSLQTFADPVLGLRLTGALGGALAVPATYLAGRQLFDRRVGLVAGVLLAASHMHIHLSRIPFWHASDALTAAVAMFGLARGLARRDPAWMAVSGVALGLAQYGYVGGRLIDLVVVVYLGLLILIHPRFIRDRLGTLAAMAGAALIVAAPMMYWALFRTGDYFARINSVGLLQTSSLAERAASAGVTPWQIVLNQWRDAWMAVVAYPAAMFYDAHIAMLDSLWAAFLVLGFIVALWRWRDWRMLLPVLQLVGGLALLAFALVPGVAVYRASGILAACAILAGVAVVVLVQAGFDGLQLGQRTPWVVGLILVVMIAGYNLNYYFREHLPNCRYMDQATGNASVVADFIRRRTGTDTVFAQTEADYRLDSYPSVLFLTRRQPVALASMPPDTPAPGATGSAERIYLISRDAPDLLGAIGPVRPAWVVVGPTSVAALDGLERVVPGGERVALERCGQSVAEAYRLP